MKSLHAIMLLLLLPVPGCSHTRASGTEGTDALSSATGAARECVVLLHGLARTSRSMNRMEESLADAGYHVVNVDYPSRSSPIEDLAREVVPGAAASCKAARMDRVNFVTHSLGGILVRYYLDHHQLPGLGRVVMLSPPNQGSEVVDALGRVPGFAMVNGQAGSQLGTGPDNLPSRLGPVYYEVGVITGDTSINLLLSLVIPGPDDGKVSVERARLAGMSDFLVVHHAHPFIMNSDMVIAQAVHFLRTGHFVHMQDASGALMR